MDSIKCFLREVSTCDTSNGLNGLYSYNGIGLDETSSAYQKRLHALYEEALVEIPFLVQETKDGIVGIIDRYREAQSLFDVPDESVLESMNRDIENGNTNTSLRRERDFVKMVCDCVSLQKYYLNEFAMTIGYQAKTTYAESNDIEITTTNSTDNNLIKGVKGLADFLGCGINTAQNIVNSEILLKKKIQYNTGKGWRFRKDKLTELLEKEPEILKKVRKK